MTKASNKELIPTQSDGLLKVLKTRFEKSSKRHADIEWPKVQEKLGNEKRMVEALEHAARLQPNKQTYIMLGDAYRKVGRDEEAAKIESAMKRATVKIQKAPKIKQPRKIVM